MQFRYSLRDGKIPGSILNLLSIITEFAVHVFPRFCYCENLCFAIEDLRDQDIMQSVEPNVPHFSDQAGGGGGVKDKIK